MFDKTWSFFDDISEIFKRLGWFGHRSYNLTQQDLDIAASWLSHDCKRLYGRKLDHKGIPAIAQHQN